jgi:tetratricopeptide (TPR) repeat protein
MPASINKILQLIDSDSLQEAKTQVDELLGEDEFNYRAIALRAKIFYRQKAFEKAIDDYNYLVNLLPKNTEYISDRGLAYHMLGFYDQALADFDEVINLEPDNPYWFACRAFIKDYIKDYVGALEDYEVVLTLDPDDAIALNNKGLLEEKMGYMTQSRKSFQQADELHGVDLDKEIGHLEIPVQQKNEIHSKSAFKHFLTVLKTLFRSAQERRRFLNFIFKPKVK